MKGGVMGALLAALLAGATPAGAYESRDIEDVPRAAPGAPVEPAPTEAPGGGYTPGEPAGSPTQDEWIRNEVAVLVTARVVDAKRSYPLDRARVILSRPGGPPHEIARTDETGAVHARFSLHDPPPKIEGGKSAVSGDVVVRVERPGYLPYEGSFGPGSLPKKGRYAWINLGDLGMRPMPTGTEAP